MSESEFEYEDEYEDVYSSEDEHMDSTVSTDNHAGAHRCHTTRDLLQQMAGQANELAEVLGLETDDAVTLLHHYKWNSERLMDTYMDHPEKTRSDAGLITRTESKIASGRRHYDSPSEFTCMICCEDEQESYRLSCGHEYCMNCYTRYVEERIQKGDIIRCPSCDVSLDRSDVDAICGRGVSDQLLESSIKVYVERHKTYKWCPAPDCNIVVEVLDPIAVTNLTAKSGVPVATCALGHQFCLSCNLENHVPLPCDTTAAWIKKCKDDSETIKWINTNTKKCKRCGTSIEKNGGCNHMTCKKCSHEFCWICGGDWKSHGTSYFQCNRYQATDKNKEESYSKAATKESLDRYLHFYNFFQVHDKSTRLDSKRCSEVEEAVKLLQETSGISWIEAQFLTDSATALLRSRRVLKWSYPFAFYCDKTNYFNIFENVQARLASDVEALSKLFEIADPLIIVEKKLEFLNAAQHAYDSQKAMCSCAIDCIANGTMTL